MKSQPIGEILKECGYLTEQQLQEALAFQKQHPEKRIGTVLLENGYITERQKLDALSKKSGAELIDLNKFPVDVSAVEKIPQKLAAKYTVLAVKATERQITVAMNETLDAYAVEDIRQMTGLEPIVVLCELNPLLEAIKYYYSDVRARLASRAADSVYSANDDDFDIPEGDGDAPIIKLLDSLLARGYSRSASDIHIEPFSDKSVVRMRVDGMLVNFVTLKTSVHPSLIARIKVLAGMNIAQKRIPQDGHIVRKVEGKVVNTRVSVIPTVYGEKAVLRLLGTEAKIDRIGQYGMDEVNYNKFNAMLGSPNGIVYITGPTGSGKTTTLYMAIERLTTKNSNISTIEDPVERNIPAVNQMQVEVQAGLTFDVGLRALLRQDPDIIMVGETRDAETASISVRAAITGHLVLSTLHTNSAAASIVRLADMGIEPYLIASSVVGIVAQRLVGKICPRCGRLEAPTPEEAAALGGNVETVIHAEGCEFCGRTGFSGRTAIHETLIIDREVKRMILRSAPTEEIEEYAKAKQGMKLLRDTAKELVLQGITTVGEMNKVGFAGL